MKRRFLKFAFFVALAMTIPVPGYTAENTAEHEFFENRIRPILVRHCYECHAGSLKEPKGGLQLDWRDGIRKGQWKLVNAERGATWELYDMNADPTETTNVAELHPEKVARMVTSFERWQSHVDDK